MYSSGHVTVPQMARAGSWLNLLLILLITGLTRTAVVWVLGVQPGVLPGRARAARTAP